jgi:hypothetical protein
VFLVVLVTLSVLTVPLAGGRVSALADMRFRGAPMIFAALAIQVAIITVAPEGTPLLHRVLHIATYVLAAAFLLVNHRVAGLRAVALGAALNVVAISANSGVMPASKSALRFAGQLVYTQNFLNSTALAHPKLLFLGDIFGIPASLPLHNVFSIGDVCIALGAATAIHALCGSSLVPRSWRLAARPEVVAA